MNQDRLLHQIKCSELDKGGLRGEKTVCTNVVQCVSIKSIGKMYLLPKAMALK